MTSKANEAARLLSEANASGRKLAALPADVRPAGIEEAYAIQRAWPRATPIYGWKVGPGATPDGLCAAPLLGDAALRSSAEVPFSEGLAVEVEVTVTLGANNSIASLHMSYELFQSRYVDRKQVDFPSVLADYLNNAGIVVGPATTAEIPLESLEVVLTEDGKEIARTATGMSLNETKTNIAWLARHAAESGAPLAAGTVILTGARLGPIAVKPGSRYVATSALGQVELFATQSPHR
jgi:2-keto-4-pentenoate hydratase